jgi:hypothetical protein
MIKPYKNRQLVIGQVVEVYRNLHNDLFSLRDKGTGLVVAHGNNFCIFNCTFNVTKSGRDRVIKEKKKNVHAWGVGQFMGGYHNLPDEPIEVYYDPYKYETFINKETSNPVHNVFVAIFKDGKVIATSDKYN